jgi:hypothetical protein
MKKLYLSGLSIFLLGTSLSAQYTENFDSYTAGAYLGVVSVPFTTWSGTQGGAEDVQIVNNASSSSPNSIYFSSTSASGGPDDVVLPFGGPYSTGFFEWESKFFVETGKGAYFNFQANATLGSVWAMDCQMVNDGNMYISNGGTTFITTTYPTNTWFTLRMEIDLNSNNWEVFIDGVSQGSFANPVNRIASIDYFPVNAALGGNNLSGFWVDDVMYMHTPYTLPARNGAVTLISVASGLATQTRDVVTQVRNLGTTAITSFDLSYTYNGNTINESVTGVNITSLNTYNYTFTQDLTLVTGNNPIVVTISNVNGSGADDDVSDDSKTLNLNPVTPAANRKVVAEEGTGTWCGWCPRGAVFMDDLSNKYGDYFIGIAVHNNDPMTVTVYDAGISAQIAGYPSGLVDRGTSEVDPSGFETPFLQRIVIAPSGTMVISGSYNAGSSTLTVDVTTTFAIATSGSWKLACVLTEDGVTGTGTGWSQTNYYAGGGNGTMGGYEALPNPVPAAQMVYDHVARAIEPSFAGQAAFTSTINMNDVFTTTFTFTVDPTWDLSNLNIVSMLINPSGQIDNAEEKAYSDVIGINEEMENNFGISLYPNPADEYSNISLDLNSPEQVQLSVIDINGKVVASRNYGTLNGKMLLPVMTENFAAGIYLVNITVGNKIVTRRLIVE